LEFLLSGSAMVPFSQATGADLLQIAGNIQSIPNAYHDLSHATASFLYHIQ
jgi:hypothetical protein